MSFETERMYREWTDENADELLEMCHSFHALGTDLFGSAFFQLGTVSDFCWFVYTHLQPGLTQ